MLAQPKSLHYAATPLNEFTIQSNCEQMHKQRYQLGHVYPLTRPYFDNTPRRDVSTAAILYPRGNKSATVERIAQYFRNNVETALRYQKCCNRVIGVKDADKFIVVSSWNEWGEGLVLEPSDVFGNKFLDAIKQAKQKINIEMCDIN